MADVADAAGVAVQTVYFVFHTKTEVLNSTYTLAVMGEDDPAPPEMQEWYRQAVSEPDVTSAIRLVVGGVAEILRRVAPLDQAVRSAAAGDPDAAAFLSQNEGMRADGYREMVSFLHLKRPLRDDRLRGARDRRHAVPASPGSHRALAVERAWTHAEWVDWISGTMAEQLFGVPRLGTSDPSISG